MSIVDTTSLGSGSFIQTLQLLANPEEVQRRFNELVTKQAEAEKLLALVGPANEVLAIREEVLQTRQKAWDELAAAQAQAKEILNTADAEARSIKEQAVEVLAKQQAEEARTTARLAELERAAQAKAAEAAALHEETIKAADAVEDAKAKLALELEAAKAVRVSYENRVEALKSLLANVQEAFGRL